MNRVPHSTFEGVAWPRSRGHLIAAGITDAQLRGPRWQRTSYGLYVPADVDLTGALQRIALAAGRLPAAGAVGGWAAARALGVDLCDGLASDGRTPLDAPLCIGAGDIRSVDGIAIWAVPLPESDVVVVERVRVTSPLRTCFDGMRRAGDLVEAVVFADLMLHSELVDLPQLRAYVAAHSCWRGVGQARQALDLTDPMARNGWETRLRMIWMLDAGLPRPLCNPPVFDLSGNLLGFPDLLDPEAGMAGEFDGSGHRELAQHDLDNIREELFEDHGLVVSRATSIDIGHRLELARRFRRAHARGRVRDRRNDRWTLDAPADWGALDADAELAALFEASERSQ